MAHSLILSTTSTKDEAQNIAKVLVERKLVACVNIVGPIESIYRWKGEVENAQEFLMVIKTEAGRFAEVRDAIKGMHSYEVPELIEVSIENGSADYLKWISESIA